MTYSLVSASRRLNRLAANFPSHGLAFHGTTLEKARSIRRRGLKPMKMSAYVSVLPTPVEWGEPISGKKAVENLIGSILFASGYSFSPPFYSSSKLLKKDYPAVVIFRGDKEHSFKFGGYDEDVLRSRGRYLKGGRGEKQYTSFGKGAFRYGIKSNRVVAVVRLSRKDMDDCLKKSSQNPVIFYRLVRAKLVTKVLIATQKEIEKGSG